MLMLACLLATTAARAAAAPDSIEDLQNLAQAGAVHLALSRIEMLQPSDTVAPSWTEWERLRLQLLVRLGRNDEVLQRAGVLPSHLPAATRAELHVIAAGAALVLGRTAVAREHAGRALWTPGLAATTRRELRLLVIRSHVREFRADDAYRSMLRFEQDYRPLEAATATMFVDALLDLGLVREAVNWLGLLGERSPVKLRLRLHAGVVRPQDAVTQARAALGRSADPAWWRILLEAADRQGHGTLRIEAMEQLLELQESVATTAPDAASGLWESYIVHARAAANTHQLLAGDDAGWLEFAILRHSADPAEARAYLAYLARHGRDPALLRDAQIRLAADYAGAKLPRAGLRMFGSWPGKTGELAVQTRQILGALAEKIGDQPLTLHYWQGLPAPENMPADVWRLRLSALALRGGSAGAAADIARSLAAEQSAIPGAQLPEWIALAQQFADHGLHDAAQALFERMLPHADAGQSRAVLSGMARNNEARSQPPPAADVYLRIALQASSPDAAAAARLQSGLGLARAGLFDDARTQFDWVLKNARDPAQIAMARRELGF